MTPTTRVAIAIASALLGLTATASAQEDGTTDDQIVVAPFAYGSGVLRLYRLGLGSQTAAALGNYGVAGGQEVADVEGLAFAPDGQLYGISDPSKALVRLNTSTGRASLVSRLADSSLRDAASLDIGFAFTCDGRAWIASDVQGRLWEMNPADGTTSLVASTLPVRLSGLAARGNELFGVSVASQDAPTLTQSIYRIDTSSGELTRIGDFTTALPVVDAGLDFDEQGRLWATFDYNPQPGANPSVEGGIEGLAITSACNVPAGTIPPRPIEPVPSASAAGLGVLGALLALLGGLFLRRRHTTA